MEEMEKIEQPSLDIQKILDDVMAAESTDVVFLGKKRKIGWLSNGTVRRFTHVVMKEKNEAKRNCKLCALVLLNNIWKIRLRYALLWRWLYYVKDVNAVEILRVVDVAKKKIPSTACSLLTILATGMTDVMMAMTKEEVKAIQAEQAGAQPTR